MKLFIHQLDIPASLYSTLLKMKHLWSHRRLHGYSLRDLKPPRCLLLPIWRAYSCISLVSSLKTVGLSTPITLNPINKAEQSNEFGPFAPQTGTSYLRRCVLIIFPTLPEYEPPRSTALFGFIWLGIILLRVHSKSVRIQLCKCLCSHGSTVGIKPALLLWNLLSHGLTNDLTEVSCSIWLV